jgi:hypothetical protein
MSCMFSRSLCKQIGVKLYAHMNKKIDKKKKKCRYLGFIVTQVYEMQSLFTTYSFQDVNDSNDHFIQYNKWLYDLWQHRLWSFKLGNTKLDTFLAKNEQDIHS